MLRATVALAAALTACLLAAGAALADPAEVSSNWSGYVATGLDGVPATFTDVTATWVQPKATCTNGRIDAAAFWVGLGGNSPDSSSLEQLGTSVSCDGSSTKPVYESWWEIVPAASVPIPLRVHPGDRINAAVLVNGQTVTMSLKNLTRHTRFSRTMTPSQPLDVSSAEWIAEAPSTCTAAGRCTPFPLTRFGNVTFTKATAIGNAHAGTISDPAWSPTLIELISGGSNGAFFGNGSDDPLGAGIGALPGSLSTDGRSFSVNWQTNLTP